MTIMGRLEKLITIIPLSYPSNIRPLDHTSAGVDTTILGSHEILTVISLSYPFDICLLNHILAGIDMNILGSVETVT